MCIRDRAVYMHDFTYYAQILISGLTIGSLYALIAIGYTMVYGLSLIHILLRLLEQYDAWDRVVLASFHDEIYEEYQRLQKAGEVPESFMCSPGVGGVAKFYLLQAVNADVFFGDQMCVFQLPVKASILNLATEAFVKRMHSHNLAVHYWTCLLYTSRCV